MTALVIVGAQWGDEGKGKVVDLLAAHADAVVRYGGGANAGHTLVVGDEKVVFHLVPSGALHARPRCWLGTGMVIDPRVLVDELAVMRARGVLDDARVLVSDRAQLVLPQHFLVDALREQGPSAIGTTKRGIGPSVSGSRRSPRAADDRSGRSQRFPRQHGGEPRGLEAGHRGAGRRAPGRSRGRGALPGPRAGDPALRGRRQRRDPRRPRGGATHPARRRAGDDARPRPRHLPLRDQLLGDGRWRVHGHRAGADAHRSGARHQQGLHDAGRWRALPHRARRRGRRAAAAGRRRVRRDHRTPPPLRLAGHPRAAPRGPRERPLRSWR